MKKILLCLLFAILLIQSGNCQKAPVVFGKINPEEINMKTYDPDTSAVAVVLTDYGWFDPVNFIFTKTIRMKILKKAGSGYADFRYHSMSKPSVRGITYNLNGGDIVKEKLPASSIFSKRISDDTYETSIAMPNIKEGSVFDLEYKFFGLPYEWKFQESIPVKYSELNIQESPDITLSKNFFGYIPLTVSTKNRWVAVNVPAIKSEPYINSINNYLTKIEIDIRSISLPDYSRAYTTSWESVNDVLEANVNFPSENQAFLCLSSIVNEIKSSDKKGEDLIKAAFDAAKKISYNGENSIYISDEGLCSHYRSGSGNSADVNFTLLQILRLLGVEAFPVVLSTRSNGLLSTFNPSINKLNYVILAIKNDNEYKFLDATEKYMPTYMLPDRVINGNGRIVSSKNSQWIALNTKEKETAEYKYEMMLHEDMTLAGKIKMALSGYAAFDFRKHFATFNNKEEYARNAEKTNPGLIIKEISIENAEDLYKPVNVLLDATIEGVVNQVDKEIFITPMLFEQVKENPFNAATRLYPINYSRLTETKVEVELTIPVNIKAEILPQQVSSNTSKNSIAFTYAVTAEEGKIKAKYSFNINSLSISQDQYKEVRSLYNNLVSKHAEPVILKIQ